MLGNRQIRPKRVGKGSARACAIQPPHDRACARMDARNESDAIPACLLAEARNSTGRWVDLLLWRSDWAETE